MSTAADGKSLESAVLDHPFRDFQDWWLMGDEFTNFMAKAIRQSYEALAAQPDINRVKSHYENYLHVVYQKDVREGVFEAMLGAEATSVASGEFDAFSYAFYRSAFQHVTEHPEAFEASVEGERRLFTKEVGKRFFAQVEVYTELSLPDQLSTADDFAKLKSGIAKVGNFLRTQGYLRDHFAFHFDVDIEYQQQVVSQKDADVLDKLRSGTAYALYEMGYPVILPSAVYLYQLVGEAQHHSSRTIEDLFARVGCKAREVDDFDPRNYPSDRVVELWEIKRL
jgi:hypothetical protein